MSVEKILTKVIKGSLQATTWKFQKDISLLPSTLCSWKLIVKFLKEWFSYKIIQGQTWCVYSPFGAKYEKSFGGPQGSLRPNSVNAIDTWLRKIWRPFLGVIWVQIYKVVRCTWKLVDVFSVLCYHLWKYWRSKSSFNIWCWSFWW